MAPDERLKRVTEDCFAALVRLYVSPANPKWAGYADATRDLWQRELDFAARPDCLGAVSLQVIRPSLVQAYFDGLAGRPGKQQAALAALRQLEKWAIVRELLPRQITLGVEVERSKDGHIPWDETQVALAETHARPDLARAVTLAANSGQRGSDLIRMCPSDIELFNGAEGHNVVQRKTGRHVWVPITSPLARAIETWSRVPGPYLRRPEGTPWPDRKALTQAWKYERDNNPALAPLKAADLTMHGLRGTACVRLRRAGANAQQIADMVGMSIPMVERYCRFSAQKENASAAIVYLERTLRERELDKSNGSAS